MKDTIVLASGSATRRAILESAGLSILIDVSNVDEERIKRDCVAQGLDIAATAERLALTKAIKIQERHPGKIVLGGDQMLCCDGAWFDKPTDRAAAALQLSRLAGRTHSLVSAIVALCDGITLWSAIRTAEMTMRPLSPAFIESYLDQIGDSASKSVGAYQIEGIGIQLFSAIEGDYFTVMGLPLLPLLEFLRTRKILPT